ncbi:hypothetical protein ACXYMO_15385 [Arenibacterium sp. CAU 1754]
MTQKTSTRWGRAMEIWQAFVAGFVESSRAAFVAMLIGFLAIASIALWYFSYATLGSPVGVYLMRSELDVDGYATYRSLHAAQTPNDSPLALILGSSVMASAFAFEELTAQEISEKTGEQWHVAMLTTAKQSPLDQFALLETVLQSAESRKNQRIVVVLGVDVTLNAWTPEKMLEIDRFGRLGIRSDWADQEVLRLGGTPRPRYSFYIADNWNFFRLNGGKTLMRLLARTPAQPRLDIFAPKVSWPEEKRNGPAIAAQIRSSFDPENQSLLHTLRELAQRLSDYENLDLVLFHETPSPDFVEARRLTEIVAAESARYREFSREIGAHFWSPIIEAGVSAEAYHDHYHIGKSDTQARLRSALAEKISELEAK